MIGCFSLKIIGTKPTVGHVKIGGFCKEHLPQIALSSG